MAYPFWAFPFWTCNKCGRKYSALENYCFFCHKKEEKEKLPPRHQFRDVDCMPSLRHSYYEEDLPID